jgi:hypothetical protein
MAAAAHEKGQGRRMRRWINITGMATTKSTEQGHEANTNDLSVFLLLLRIFILLRLVLLLLVVSSFSSVLDIILVDPCFVRCEARATTIVSAALQ